MQTSWALKLDVDDPRIKPVVEVFIPTSTCAAQPYDSNNTNNALQLMLHCGCLPLFYILQAVTRNFRYSLRSENNHRPWSKFQAVTTYQEGQSGNESVVPLRRASQRPGQSVTFSMSLWKPTTSIICVFSTSLMISSRSSLWESRMLVLSKRTQPKNAVALQINGYSRY